MRAVKALLEEESATIITSIDGCMDYLMPLEEISRERIAVSSGGIINLQELEQRLSQMGYERAAQVEVSGQFSVRGGIIDIYPLTEDTPWRIELWDDEVDSIRSFDVESQRSLQNLEEILIYPACEKISEEGMVSFLEYFPPEESLIFLDEPGRIKEQAIAVQEELEDSLAHRQEKGESRGLRALFCEFTEVQKQILGRRSAALSTLDAISGEWKVKKRFHFQIKSVNSYNNSFELLVKDLKQLKKDGYAVILLSGSAPEPGVWRRICWSRI